MTNKEFWKKILTFFDKQRIFFRGSNNDVLVSHEKLITEIINKHYISIVEKSSDTMASSWWDSAYHLIDETVVEKIIDKYQNHPNITAIKLSVTQSSKTKLPYVTTQDK